MISEFPLFVFTTLSGIAAGAYFTSAFFPKVRQGQRAWLFSLVCIILLAVGLLGTLAHLGHPERFLNALANPGAMIAQEAYWSAAFGVLMLIDCILLKVKGESPRWLGVLAAIAALGLMLITANAYFTSHAVAVWATWHTWLLFVAGDIAMGAALAWVFQPEGLAQGKSFVWAYAAVSALALIGIASCALAFGAEASESAPFIVALVIGPVASTAVAFLAAWQKAPARKCAWAALALCVVGIAIARYAYYMASIL